MATVSELWDLLHEAAPYVPDGELQNRIQDALDDGTTSRPGFDEVCDELAKIVYAYENRTCSTPGGLEHMGDVWRLLCKWNDMLVATDVQTEPTEKGNE